MALFKKKKPDENGNGAVGVTVGGDAETAPVAADSGDQAAEKPKGKAAKKAARAYKRDPRKARSFFRHAETVAETRNYNYAIDCYINGLRHDPDNMIKHEALREIALRRKVSGDSPAKFKERMQRGAKDKVDKMLHAEMLWSKDPLNLGRMIDLMEKAAEADEAEPDLNIGELVHWVGVLILEKGETQKPPSKGDVLKVRDLFSRVGAWEASVNATRALIQMEPEDLELVEELKDLEAELAMLKGGYAADARQAVRDLELQQTLDTEDRISRSDSASEQLIARRREDLVEKPEDVDRKLKLIKVLAETDSDDAEDEAIKLLEEVYEENGQYRHRMAIGDIRIKQISRNLRLAREAAKANPNDQQAAEIYKKLTRKRLKLETSEFTARVQNYPTDMKWRYELGRRQFMVKQHEEAITNFQQARVDPKYRPAAHCYLGRCYIIQEWYDEAIDTLRSALEQLPDQDGQTAIEMKWYLCAALVKSAQENNSVELAKEAQKVASQILQVDVNYRDIKDRLDQIRALVKKLQQNAI